MGISSSSPLARQLGSETDHPAHIVTMLRMSGAKPSLPHTPACYTWKINLTLPTILDAFTSNSAQH